MKATTVLVLCVLIAAITACASAKPKPQAVNPAAETQAMIDCGVLVRRYSGEFYKNLGICMEARRSMSPVYGP